ncbi:MAG: asparagine--tRNA ligase [Clostridia bacterium]|nr:asparagine--tRNA ligase [Clostridia bacterium]
MQYSVRQLFRQTPKDQTEVTVSGWVRTLRDSKVFAFIEVNDGTFFKNVQVVCEDGLENFKDIVKTTLGSAIRVTGILALTPEMKQPFEIKARKVEIVGLSDPSYPLQKKRHTVEYLRTQAHLRPRTNLFSAVFRIRSLAAQAIHAFFAERSFVYVHTPLITASDAEGAGEMFRVTTLDLNNLPKDERGKVIDKEDFFGRPANLTVSGQLNVECFAQAFRNVYTFGPTFRAEKSYTPRHAAEFWMIEPEIAFADLEDDMELAEDMLKYVIADVMAKAPEEMEFLNNFVDKDHKLIERLTNVVSSKFARCSYTDAIEILQKADKQFEYPVHWGMDIQTEHERYLAEEHFGSPVCVYNYPKEIKAFYMRQNEDGKTVAAVDILVPGIGELIGGSQREERLDVLEARIKELGLDMDSYWWYLELRKFGTTPHAGFGLGFERLIMYLTSVANIRDVLPFPRTTGSADF